jgi:hypothetical protein
MRISSDANVIEGAIAGGVVGIPGGRVGECLLLKEERKSGLRGPISAFDPKAKWRVSR